MDLLALYVTVHYCLRFVVREVVRRTAGWSLVAVDKSVARAVVVMSGRLHLTAAQIAGQGTGKG